MLFKRIFAVNVELVYVNKYINGDTRVKYMGDTKWTKEQLDAITGTGCNMLVAAAAGAGKTAVLVERIIRKITDNINPVDIDKLLIVTFTNAAATEMRERIGEAIVKALEQNDSSKGLQRQRMLLNRASITTIHSFCLEVIRNNFHYIDLDPSFRIADDTEATLLKLEAIEELFEDKYEAESQDTDFLQLVECYSGSRDDSQLQNIILNTFEFVQSYPWPEKWLSEKAEAFNVQESCDFGSTLWAQILVKSVSIELSGLCSILQRAIHIIKYSEGLSPYLSTFQEDLNNLSTLLDLCRKTGTGSTQSQFETSACSWDTLYNAFSSIEFGKLGRCGKDADAENQSLVKELRDDIKKRFKKIREDIFTSCSSQINNDLEKVYPLIKCLCNLVMDFDKRYSFKKREKSLLDFNDLEHLCLQILTEEDEKGNIHPTKVALDFRERFTEILIDEYQDSNLVQEVILGTISRRETDIPNVFMVGDIKQSIYRFRQAKPELFLEKYNIYSLDEKSKSRKVQLFKNFRSREEVINSVNFVFKQIMSTNVGELDYNEKEALNLGARYAEVDDELSIIGGPTELHLLDVTGKGDKHTEVFEHNVEDGSTEDVEDETEPNAGDEEHLDVIQTEARLIIKRIKDLMKPDSLGKIFKVLDKGTKAYRALDYKDIVILLRATRNWADVFVEEMSSMGIPAYADSGTGYFKTIEVQVVMSLLEIIDNPMQDIPMLAVLRSPIASFSPEELIEIRLADRKASFYEAMKQLESGMEGTTVNKVGVFLNNLKEWRQKALYLPTDELLWYLYTHTGYFSYVGAMPGGTQRQANLRILFERARQYEKTSYKGLFNFINFINKLKQSSGDMGSAKILGENENVVRIMSIHKSKGLEFPVVILAGCGKQFNLMDMNKSILLHQDLGFGPDYVDHLQRNTYPTIPKQALRYKTRIESLSEEMRILYVAFTRAKEKLIITGCIKGIDKVLTRWSNCLKISEEKLPEYEMLRAKNYMDWIGTALIRHKNNSNMREFVVGSFADESNCLIDDLSLWEIKLWYKSDFLGEKQEEEFNQVEMTPIQEIINSKTGVSPYSENINKRLSWNYKYIGYSRIPTKISVTELKRHFNVEVSEEYVPESMNTLPLVKKPLFLENSRELNSAEKGTVMHFVMQHLDLYRVESTSEIKKQVHEMTTVELLTEQQAKSVDIGKIAAFFRSEIGSRMLKADRVYREVPFNVEIKCSEIYKDQVNEMGDEETILIQGVIDCYFEEQEGMVLVDYKTDYVPEGGTLEVVEKYKVQIDYYTRALESITSKKVVNRYIYLFWNGEIIEI